MWLPMGPGMLKIISAEQCIRIDTDTSVYQLSITHMFQRISRFSLQEK
jgi:hypothetical protein